MTTKMSSWDPDSEPELIGLLDPDFYFRGTDPISGSEINSYRYGFTT
jgi:hypothetical protein